MDQAEAMFESLRPLEVVDEGPVKISSHVCALTDRLMQSAQMTVEVINARPIVDAAVQ